ncbi:DUF4234 domain-containing protein [Lachnobacterium bovis]|uniref:DUF4234 domain-containing protein n=1 Tax=Lachnobacterium bovis TaxID=140626 RepID=A0A1H9R5L5_9FIRM|nr:DUF4234 domain-containing protein [Lachnobacterium bovis]SER67349.1 protein of unknown function [Lachnobacterium bovis]
MFYVEENRNAVTAILLSLVTCGIYQLVILSRIAQDTNTICQGDGEADVASIGKLILLSLVTCGIYGLYWYYKVGERLKNNGPRYNVMINESGIIYLLCAFIPYIGYFVITILLFKNLNALSKAYNYCMNNQQQQGMNNNNKNMF